MPLLSSFLVKDGAWRSKGGQKNSGNDVVIFIACSRHCIEDRPISRGEERNKCYVLSLLIHVYAKNQFLGIALWNPLFHEATFVIGHTKWLVTHTTRG